MASLFYLRVPHDSVTFVPVASRRIILNHINPRHAARRMAQIKVAMLKRFDNVFAGKLIDSSWICGGKTLSIDTDVEEIRCRFAPTPQTTWYQDGDEFYYTIPSKQKCAE